MADDPTHARPSRPARPRRTPPRGGAETAGAGLQRPEAGKPEPEKPELHDPELQDPEPLGLATLPEALTLRGARGALQEIAALAQARGLELHWGAGVSRSIAGGWWVLPELLEARQGTLEQALDPALEQAQPRAGTLEVWADGSAEPNPGQGGAALSWLFTAPGAGEEAGEDAGASGARSGAVGWGSAAEDATNNEMELIAALGAMRLALSGLPDGEQRRWPAQLILHLDSRYVRDGLKTWIGGWRRNGWRSAEGQPVANRALWEALWAHQRQLRAGDCEVELRWVRGHAGDAHNERADALARRGRGRSTPLVVQGLPDTEPPPERRAPPESARPERSAAARPAGRPAGPGTGAAQAAEAHARRKRRRKKKAT